MQAKSSPYIPNPEGRGFTATFGNFSNLANLALALQRFDAGDHPRGAAAKSG
jgi:hypothetical protein